VVRYWLTSRDLPPVTPQYEIRDAVGRVVAHADLGYEEWKVLVEYEGRQHGFGEQFDRDVERYSRMAAQGWLVIRFGREHLRRPQLMIQRVRQALLSRGWTPPPRV
jgi:very-short-patch-repair endonuclease